MEDGTPVTMELLLASLRALALLADLPGQADDESDLSFVVRAARAALTYATEARVVCALDKAAAEPDWWKVNRLHEFCPEMSHREIADFLGIKKTQTAYQIKHAAIPADVWEDLPDLPKY